jgi:hypothetical protein
MNIKPTNLTAAVAGIWTSFGLVAFEALSKSTWFTNGAMETLAWLLACGAFFFLPAIYLVFGPEARGFSHTWVNDPVERARYLTVVKRMLVWLASAGVAAGLGALARNTLG